jgi:glycosidase
MNFALARVLRMVFAQRQEPLAALLAFLDKRSALVPPNMSYATLLDNHDMHRFLWLAGGDTARLKLAALCQMTLDGVPIVYYGTEVGLSQSGDAHLENAYARAPMLWGQQQDQDVLTLYRQLIALRHAHPALRSNNLLMLPARALNAMPAVQEQVGAYLRWQGQDVVVVVVNNAEESVRLQVPLAGQLPEQIQKTGRLPRFLPTLLTRAETRTQISTQQLEVMLPPLSAGVFVGELGIS